MYGKAKCDPMSGPGSKSSCARELSIIGWKAHFAAHNRLHILVTIVPGAMTDDEIVAVA